MLGMSQVPEERIPTWDLPDRMGKALRVARISSQGMADYLGVSRNTVGNYTNGRTRPDKRTLMLWALRTGVPLEWLRSGTAETPRPGGDGGLERARYDSNVQPSDP